MNAALAQAQRELALGNANQAVQVLQAALTIHPKQADLQVGLGVALRFTGRLNEAATAFERALALQAKLPQAAVYLAMIRLAQGRQQEGWSLYEARWRNPHWPEKMRYPVEARWQTPLKPGQRLLLWGEQGFGDVIQFARYVPWLAQQLQAQGANLVVEVPAPLHRLLQTTWPALAIAPQGQLRGHFDAHLPMMDLPRLCGHCVGDGGLPYLPEPYLRAASITTGPAMDAARPLRVGLAWQGRPTHPDDRWRSIAMPALEVLREAPDITWVSLQKDVAPQPQWLASGIEDCKDFADTANLVNTLDLVISIDSAVAHLAAALGRPVWLLLPPIADWRWGLDVTTTPWYPGMRLWRQATHEDWPAVLRRIAAALTQLPIARHHSHT